jgi:hypothetical protein
VVPLKLHSAPIIPAVSCEGLPGHFTRTVSTNVVALILLKSNFRVVSTRKLEIIAKHTKVGMIWVAGLAQRGVAMNLKATTLTYLAIAAPCAPKRDH